jgi:hypothetical protein
VAPSAMKLIATPETIWLPRWVIEAKPCTSARQTETKTAAASPIRAEAGDRRGGAAGKGGGQHLALEPDVENARPLGVEAGKRRQDQRDRDPHG